MRKFLEIVGEVIAIPLVILSIYFFIAIIR